MRNCKYFVFLLIVFTGCKKNDIPVTGDFHLVRATIVGGWPYKAEFGYDASGRLLKQTVSNNANDAVVMTHFNYTGNEIAISYPDNPSFIQQDTRYLVDAQNRPAKRVYHDEDSYNSEFGPQKQFRSETTDYEYDANGYLIRQTGIFKDSTSYYPSAAGILTVTLEVNTYIVIHEIADGNLKSIKKTTQQNIQLLQGGIYSRQQTIEETTVFSYDKNYPNHFDFANAFLLNEAKVLPFTSYFPDLRFSNYPNKAVTTKVTKDASGTIISTETSTKEYNLTFNTNGYLLSNIFDPQTKLVYMYSRF